MANAKPSRPENTSVELNPKEAANVRRNEHGMLVRTDTIHTTSGPIVREVAVFEGDFKVGDQA